MASDTATADPSDTTLARAQTLTLEGVALMYSALNQRDLPRARPEETRAHAALHEAYLLTRANARQVETGSEITPYVRAHATAMAWHSALRARLRSLQNRPWDGEDRDTPTMELNPPVCPFDFRAQPLPEYPEEAEDNLEVGVVVVWFHFDEAGAITRRQVITTAPATAPFVHAVESVYDRWTVSWERNAPEGCRRGFAMIAPVTFLFPD